MRDTERVIGSPTVVALPQAPDVIELRHLRAFIVVAEELSFSRAAERLSITRPALTREIRALERLAGCDLFYRSDQRVELTLAGESLLASACRVLPALDGEIPRAGSRATTTARTKKPSFLGPGEHVLTSARMHPAVLTGPVAATLAGLAVAGSMTSLAVNGGRAVSRTIVALVIWLAWLGIVSVLVTSLAAWRRSRILVTSKRLILTASPSVIRSTPISVNKPEMRYASVNINKITNWWLFESHFGRLFGYRRLVLGSGGDDRAARTITYVPAPCTRDIVAALPPIARRDDDLSVFAHWAPHPLRRSFLAIGKTLIISTVIASTVLAVVKPHTMPWLTSAAAIVAQLGFGLLSLISPA